MLYNGCNSYREKCIMPSPRCHDCGQDIHLDVFTYWNYSGSVTCEHCKNRQHVVLSNGLLLQSAPAIDPQFSLVKHQNIPEQVYADYWEVVVDLINQSYKSCAVMCRRSLQGALLVKGIPDARLSDMIQKAARTQPAVLPTKLERLARTVTFFGNSGAHPQDQEINEVGKLEATQGLLVTKEILTSLFPPPRTIPTVIAPS